jgi:hypothetical protein
MAAAVDVCKLPSSVEDSLIHLLMITVNHMREWCANAFEDG